MSIASKRVPAVSSWYAKRIFIHAQSIIRLPISDKAAIQFEIIASFLNTDKNYNIYKHKKGGKMLTSMVRWSRCLMWCVAFESIWTFVCMVCWFFPLFFYISCVYETGAQCLNKHQNLFSVRNDRIIDSILAKRKMWAWNFHSCFDEMLFFISSLLQLLFCEIRNLISRETFCWMESTSEFIGTLH